MKPFNLQEFLANPSRKIVTRDGRSVRIICTDAKQDYSIVALLTHCEDVESVMCYTKDGRRNNDVESQLDLFCSTDKREGWVNIYRNGEGNIITSVRAYDTKEKAEKAKDNFGYLGTTHIEWED